MRDMGRNMGTQIDAAMFASTSLGGGAPAAIVTGALTFTESAAGGAAGTSADMLEAIQTIADDHGLDGNLAFVNSWFLYSNIKSATQVASVSPLYQDDRLAGYPGYFSKCSCNCCWACFWRWFIWRFLKSLHGSIWT